MVGICTSKQNSYSKKTKINSSCYVSVNIGAITSCCEPKVGR